LRSFAHQVFERCAREPGLDRLVEIGMGAYRASDRFLATQ
jgi:hypothetical protein